MRTATRPIALYEPEFARDPQAAYRLMREQSGPLVPVELAPGVPATLVIGYEVARRILTDQQRFPADPRRWQASMPADHPILPMLEWRPNALRNAGVEHARYRSANLGALDAVDQHALRARVERIATASVAGFRADGTADLVSQYAFPLVFQSLTYLLGCPDEIAARIADGMAKIFDGVHAVEGNHQLTRAVLDLVAFRRDLPGDDITTRLAAHEAGLDDAELAHQIITIFGASSEPLTNLIVNTLLAMLTDPDLSGDLHAGDASVSEALDAVLYRDPPLANFGMTYPPRPVDVGGYLIPADQPVVISFSACNNDPVLGDTRALGNRAHLAWSAGPHRCPASSHAYLIAETAIFHVLDALPELDLAGRRDDLVWRPGPFHRSLTALPVTFPLS
ncbi:cytochrome P450 [Myceligenerans crystallogenes]|uniref:Cytochrome P450 n=1 Tax=Myceligenerans crystallogenes TaxID=316335 RepID=A0ABP4ZM30_9MICO